MVRRRRLIENEETFEYQVAVPDEAEADDVPEVLEDVVSEEIESVSAVAEIAEDPAEKPLKSRDYGNWKFTPWKGIPMWTNRKGETSFDEKYVRKFRHL